MIGAYVSHAAVELQSASQLRKGATDGNGERERESEADRYNKVLKGEKEELGGKSRENSSA